MCVGRAMGGLMPTLDEWASRWLPELASSHAAAPLASMRSRVLGPFLQELMRKGRLDTWLFEPPIQPRLSAHLKASLPFPFVCSHWCGRGAWRSGCVIPPYNRGAQHTLNAPLPLPCLQPLVREGRMDKWLFEPTREEMAGMLRPLFAPQLDATEVDALLDAFPAQVS